MKIGFTYDLKSDYLQEGYSKDEVAELDSEITVDAVTAVMESMGHTVDRVGNFKSLIHRLSSGARWDFVFNICEGLYGSGREALVPATLDAYKIPYVFSTPLAHAVTLDKAVAKAVLKAKSVPVTDFIVVKAATDLDGFPLGYPCFVKPISEGTGKGITPNSIVRSYSQLHTVCEALIKEFHQPVIVEPYLDGREVTVGVLGNGAEAECIGVLEVAFTDKSDAPIHSYYNKANCESAAMYTLISDSFAQRCAEIAVAAHRALDIQDLCRVDIRADAKGNPYVMEVNSLPGLMPKVSDLVILVEAAGKTHDWLIKSVVNTAIKRIFK